MFLGMWVHSHWSLSSTIVEIEDLKAHGAERPEESQEREGFSSSLAGA
jgi:hypothetical protein